jgi:hypothetical protein
MNRSCYARATLTRAKDTVITISTLFMTEAKCRGVLPCSSATSVAKTLVLNKAANKYYVTRKKTQGIEESGD